MRLASAFRGFLNTLSALARPKLTTDLFIPAKNIVFGDRAPGLATQCYDLMLK
jgi:hypothetical protein